MSIKALITYLSKSLDQLHCFFGFGGLPVSEHLKLYAGRRESKLEKCVNYQILSTNTLERHNLQ